MSIFDDTIGMFTRAVGVEPSQLPMVGGLFDDPAEEAHAAQMRKVAEGLGMYRDPMAQSQTNAINQSLGAFGPANTMMGMMYGPQFQMNFDAMGANPLVPGQTAIGNTAPQPPPAVPGAAPAPPQPAPSIWDITLGNAPPPNGGG